MTAATHHPLPLRLLLVGLATLTCLVFGVLTLRRFGVGPSLFLFALAAVGVVDLIATVRRR